MVFYNFFRWLDKKRRESWKKRKIQRSISCNRGSVQYCGPAHNVLLLSTSKTSGDSLYLMGMGKLLREKGMEVSIACWDALVERYEKSNIFDKVYSLDREQYPGAPFSVVVDLECINFNHWDIRKDYLEHTEGYRITTSHLLKDCSFYDEFIDYSLIKHNSERLGKVCQKILNDDSVNKVYPFAKTNEYSDNVAESFVSAIANGRRIVYVNTRAGHDDRSFSVCQTRAILEVLKKRKEIVVVLLPPKAKASFSDDAVVLLPDFDFETFCAFIKRCNFVITPDTSVSHVADSFKVPCLTFFGANDRDYYKKYAAWEAWCPIYEKSKTIHPDCENIRIDRWGFSNCRAEPISAISQDLIVKEITSFVNERLDDVD